jgi:hypothetical protein
MRSVQASGCPISIFSLLTPVFHHMLVPAGEVEHDFKSLRKLAANYMLQHENHFKNFLSLAKETFQVSFFLKWRNMLFQDFQLFL